MSDEQRKRPHSDDDDEEQEDQDQPQQKRPRNDEDDDDEVDEDVYSDDDDEIAIPPELKEQWIAEIEADIVPFLVNLHPYKPEDRFKIQHCLTEVVNQLNILPGERFRPLLEQLLGNARGFPTEEQEGFCLYNPPVVSLVLNAFHSRDDPKLPLLAPADCPFLLPVSSGWGAGHDGEVIVKDVGLDKCPMCGVDVQETDGPQVGFTEINSSDEEFDEDDDDDDDDDEGEGEGEGEGAPKVEEGDD
eukprot:gnl/Spiro4/25599_TR12746_c0_g1_i1.p1 gnl/Spiro4/25599_TR12746_c0_g1~~gnl/Spiro4/25599_TR12746_c0_g1_i1.p1  ORF type:complete len:261 (-),score=59.19 gnl/Spiro4/25599_TR12746_c0_g1_i1:115-849(-)